MMNDFTKLELEELLDCIGWKLGEGQADKLTFPLEAKLKAMIENYCKHEDVVMDCDGGISLECAKCGQIVVDV
jgi:hypothetical protein